MSQLYLFRRALSRGRYILEITPTSSRRGLQTGRVVSTGSGAPAAQKAGAEDSGEWSWKAKLGGIVAAAAAVASVPAYMARAMNKDDLFELELQERAPQVAAVLEPIRAYVGGSRSLEDYDKRYVGHGWQREERCGWGAVENAEHAVVVRTLNSEAVVAQVRSDEGLAAVLERAGLSRNDIVTDVRVS